MNKKFSLLLSFLVAFNVSFAGKKSNAPAPFGPVPTARQLAWHDMQMYAFIHFTTTTYRDVEWGYGDASPDEFMPTKFNPRQWVEVLKAAGMKGVVLTAKHHDGFCLWPSQLTDYSVVHSPWLDGKGDVVGSLAAEAKRAGLKFGVYLSPWDRHDMRYGSPAYIDYFRGQLKELLIGYGPIFEVWQDGANGGDGYYGGLREKRTIDNKTYYDWATTDSLIRQWQPMACIFSDGGPDARWCGNEKGSVGDPNWATLNRNNYAPGNAKNYGLQHGDVGGTHWIPAEVDVSIRPGWFYHQSEDDKVKTVEQLMDIYYTSVGRGANLILNVPPTKEGLVHPIDSARLVAFGEALQREFSRPLKAKAIKSWKATNERKGFAASNVSKSGRKTYWATDDDVREATLTMTLKKPVSLYRLRLCEPIQLGQRIESFQVEALTKEGEWEGIATGTTIGPQRLLRLPEKEVQALRVTVNSASSCPLLSEVQLFLPPEP
ncbi:MAG: alpha-L-fucosidase [Bacteroidaceae bacterium]|nr:alpha-L-fucosidase [Bacteroidaceae bacterium]